MSLSSEELLLPFVDAFSPPWPERFCELPRPEFVLPEAPRPLLPDELLLPEEPLLPDEPLLPLIPPLVDELPIPSSP
jgi:hypothetical protein